MPDQPQHFDLPFRVRAGSVLTVEQDTAGEIAACVRAVLRTPLGTVEWLPAFGRPDWAFTAGEVTEDDVLRAVEEWEDRDPDLAAHLVTVEAQHG